MPCQVPGIAFSLDPWMMDGWMDCQGPGCPRGTTTRASLLVFSQVHYRVISLQWAAKPLQVHHHGHPSHVLFSGCPAVACCPLPTTHYAHSIR